MGVQLGDILIKKEMALQDARGRVAVDAFNVLYQFVSTIRQRDGTPLMDSKGNVTSHISGLFYRTTKLLEAGVKPVFVFDGEPSALKKKTIEERRAAKREAEEEMRIALAEGRISEAAMLSHRIGKLNNKMIEESKELLKLMGLPVIQAKSEGEAQCAKLAQDGIVKATASQDYDSLLFGTPILYRNLTIAGRKKVARTNIYQDVPPEEISLEESLNALNISRRKLVWIGILVGTDFNAGVMGIGPKKGLKLVQKFDSFEDILKDLKKNDPSVEMDWQPIEELFLKPQVFEVRELKFAEPQREKVVDFMLEREFSEERVANALNRAFKEPSTSEQSKLKKWF